MESERLDPGGGERCAAPVETNGATCDRPPLSPLDAALLALYLDGYQAGIEHAAEHESARYDRIMAASAEMLRIGRKVAVGVLTEGIEEWPEFDAVRRILAAPKPGGADGG